MKEVLIFLNLCQFVWCIEDETGKRLLLNDPAVIMDRLNRLESELQTQKVTIQNLMTENQHLTNENKLQSTTIKQFSSEFQKMSNDIQTLQTAAKVIDNGETYVRWGKKSCPSNDTDLVYSGFVGGGMYNAPTSAPEPVCLPPDPDFGITSGTNRAFMYGGEFNSNFFINNGDGLDAPCALCRTRHTSSVVMIPGKIQCYPGWKREYYGYLSAGDHSYQASGSYVCVDIQPEYLSGGGSNDDGKLFTDVVAKCGSLQCPPYKNNYPLTCVVCSK